MDIPKVIIPGSKMPDKVSVSVESDTVENGVSIRPSETLFFRNGMTGGALKAHFEFSSSSEKKEFLDWVQTTEWRLSTA